MYVFISPTKTMKKSDITYDQELSSNPFFQNQANYLNNSLKTLDKEELKKIMKLSNQLGEDTFIDIKKWGQKNNIKYPAVFSYQGTAFQHLNPEKWSLNTCYYAQKYLIIISGLYGVLKPFDMIEKYRLEMGLKTSFLKGFSSLYNFWDVQIIKYLKNKINGDLIINLASNEYFKVFSKISKFSKIINCSFFEYNGDNFKIVANYSKAARGTMASFIINNQINKIDQLKEFNEMGYSFNKIQSDNQHFIFTRGN